MKLLDMVTRMSYELRLQANPEDALAAIDTAQKAAFNHDCKAFERSAVIENAIESEIPGIGYYKFPEDAREIISVQGVKSYWIDRMKRRINAPFMPTLKATALYYLQPETLETTEDDDKIIVPDEWRWQVLAMPATALLDAGIYGDKAPQAVLDTYFKEWWEAMSARPNDRQAVSSVGAW